MPSFSSLHKLSHTGQNALVEFEDSKDGAMKVLGANVIKIVIKIQTLCKLIICSLNYMKLKVVQIWDFRKFILTRIKYLGDNGISILNSFCFTNIHKNDRKFYTLSFRMDGNLSQGRNFPVHLASTSPKFQILEHFRF